MWTGVQFNGALAPNASNRWFTFNWPTAWHVVWYMVPTTPQSGNPQVEWTVGVERATAANATYWITVKNLTNQSVNFEGRFAVLN
ncbi:hypothetical protein [Variovorax sp. J22R115]|uniref:hypothetical protein n=1 Tax=Variovorax sp. J22R115 TaxID=3053509 RepID=UPI0025752A16|nr:hypothetical protein [Variovorax sp. J22R115]MDM0053806.1 hypothetical protein [Variovorax sp. J22R115]